MSVGGRSGDTPTRGGWDRVEQELARSQTELDQHLARLRVELRMMGVAVGWFIVAIVAVVWL